MSLWLLLWILVWTILAFALMGIDKWKAKHGAWRVPEKGPLSLGPGRGSLGPWLGWPCSATRPGTGPFALGCLTILILQMVGLLLWSWRGIWFS